MVKAALTAVVVLLPLVGEEGVDVVVVVMVIRRDAAEAVVVRVMVLHAIVGIYTPYKLSLRHG